MEIDANNRKLYSIGGTWTETTRNIPLEMAYGGFFVFAEKPFRMAGNLRGRLTEADGAQSVIEGYLDIGKGLLNFEKTYIDGRSHPRRAPINYSFSRNEGNHELWVGNFVLDKSEQEELETEGFDPTGPTSCSIQLIKDKVVNAVILSKIPEDFEMQKMRLIFG